MELTREISFQSKPFGDVLEIEKVRVSFNPTDIENIKKASAFIKENKFINHIQIDVTSDVVFLDEDDNEVTHWEHDPIKFNVYDDTVYLYAQHIDDSGDQIESECFEIIML
jgi:hypothetical protein